MDGGSTSTTVQAYQWNIAAGPIASLFSALSSSVSILSRRNMLDPAHCKHNCCSKSSEHPPPPAAGTEADIVCIQAGQPSPRALPTCPTAESSACHLPLFPAPHGFRPRARSGRVCGAGGVRGELRGRLQLHGRRRLPPLPSRSAPKRARALPFTTTTTTCRCLSDRRSIRFLQLCRSASAKILPPAGPPAAHFGTVRGGMRRPPARPRSRTRAYAFVLTRRAGAARAHTQPRAGSGRRPSSSPTGTPPLPFPPRTYFPRRRRGHQQRLV